MRFFQYLKIKSDELNGLNKLDESKVTKLSSDDLNDYDQIIHLLKISAEALEDGAEHIYGNAGSAESKQLRLQQDVIKQLKVAKTSMDKLITHTNNMSNYNKLKDKHS